MTVPAHHAPPPAEAYRKSAASRATERAEGLAFARRWRAMMRRPTAATEPYPFRSHVSCAEWRPEEAAGRRGLGIELNSDSYRDAVHYCAEAEREQATPSLFDLLASKNAAPTLEAAE